MNYQLYVTSKDLQAEAEKLVAFTNCFSIVEQSSIILQDLPYLLLDKQGLAIVLPSLEPYYVYDIYKKLSNRIHDANNELLVQSIRSKSNIAKLNVLDLTAGLAKDAALLAIVGYRVTMLERQPFLATIVYYALLKGFLPSVNLELIFIDSMDYLAKYSENTTIADVIYFDPMFNNANIKSLAKKDMQLIQLVVADEDNPATNAKLLTMAQKLATKVVVKRDDKQLPLIDTPKPSYVKSGKTVRFDIYLK